MNVYLSARAVRQTNDVDLSLSAIYELALVLNIHERKILREIPLWKNELILNTSFPMAINTKLQYRPGLSNYGRGGLKLLTAV